MGCDLHVFNVFFFCTFQVNLRSLGEAAGLQAGDVIFSVNGQDISLLRHKEAQEAIKRAGNNFVLTIGRSVLLSIIVYSHTISSYKNR